MKQKKKELQEESSQHKITVESHERNMQLKEAQETANKAGSQVRSFLDNLRTGGAKHKKNTKKTRKNKKHSNKSRKNKTTKSVSKHHKKSLKHKKTLKQHKKSSKHSKKTMKHKKKSGKK